jgi:molybdopterin-binding protein
MSNAYHLRNIKVTLNQKDILSVDDLAIKADQCTALLGNNGAGKSTLLRLLAFTHRPSQGDIILFDKKISWPLAANYRKRIAFVEQHPFLLNGSVYDNIKLALSLQQITKSQHKALIQHALDQTDTVHLAQQNSHSLSGGELKRVAIARAIAYQPDILLLDEPFSHLDNQHHDLLEQHIEAFSQQAGKTVVLSTHNRLQGVSLSSNTINLISGKPTTAPMVNIFTGNLNQQQFFTGKIRIYTTSELENAQHIAIDPSQIIVSKQALESSMKNSFQGRLIMIAEQATTVRLTIDCGEHFHVTISLESLSDLNLMLGSTIFLSFKASAVTVF